MKKEKTQVHYKLMSLIRRMIRVLPHVVSVRTPWILRPLCGGGEEPEGAVSVPRSHASSPVRRRGTTQDTKAM